MFSRKNTYCDVQSAVSSALRNNYVRNACRSIIWLIIIVFVAMRVVDSVMAHRRIIAFHAMKVIT